MAALPPPGSPSAAAAPKRKKEKRAAAGAPTAVAEPAAKKRKTNPVLVPVTRLLEPTAVFAQGTLQVPATIQRTLQAVEATAPPAVKLPPRAQQHAQTLMAPAVRPLAALLVDFDAWDDQPPAAALRQIYAPTLYQMAARLHANSAASARLPPAVAEAVETLVARPHATLPQGVVSTQSRSETTTTTKKSTLMETEHTLTTTTTTTLGLSENVPPPPVQRHVVDQQVGLLTPTRKPVPPPLADAAAEAGLKSNQRLKARFQADRLVHSIRLYADDPVPDPELPFGREPSAYPMLRAFLAEFGAAYKARGALQRQTAAQVPHPDLEEVTRAYLEPFRLAPEDGSERRECREGALCRCLVLAQREGRPDRGYVAREFLRPSEERAWLERRAQGLPVSANLDGPVRPCWDCLLYAWHNQVYFGNMDRGDSPLPLNTIQVRCGPGEYARECMLPPEIEGSATGIVGLVPAYMYEWRQYDVLPDGRSVLREVHMDFQSSLSQANACLGARKLRALAGPAATLPLEPALLLAGLLDDPASGERWPEWHAFRTSAHAGILADRALASAAERQCAPGSDPATRIPASWLRHSLHTHLASSSSLTDRLSPTLMAHMTADLGLPQGVSLHEALRDLCLAALDMFEPALTQWARRAYTLQTGWWRTLLHLACRPPDDAPAWLRPVAEELAVLGGWWAEHDRALYPVSNHYPTAGVAHHVWGCCLWRVAVSVLLVQVLRPWPAGRDVPWAAAWQRQAALFADTHLDLLLAGVAKSGPGLAPATDAWFFSPSLVTTPFPLHAHANKEEEEEKPDPLPPLGVYYPMATRVCSAEELPDGTTLLLASNPWFDAQNKKSDVSLLHALVHPLSKVLNQVCAKRNFADILLRAMRAYPAVARYVQLMLRVSLSGALLTGVQARPPLLVRLRIAATFAPTLSRAPLEAWIAGHPMLTITLLREYYFCLAESNGVIDEVRSAWFAWPRFKALTRHANGELRRALTRQLLANQGRGAWARMDWSALEERADSGNSSKGAIEYWHERLKDHFSKLHKGSEVETMLRKIKSAESSITKAAAAAQRPPFDTAALYAWMHAHGRLDALHVFAWRAALALSAPGRARSLVSTAPLKVLGMTEHGFDIVRAWVHGFADYHAKDNSFCALAEAIHAHAPTDFVLLKTYLGAVEYYMNDLVLIDPLPHARAKLQALRSNLDMEPWAPTPERLGLAYFCEGCLRWASTVVMPSPALLGMSELAPSVVKKPVRPVLPLPVPRGLAHGRAACMQRAFFHPLTNALHCRRAQTGRHHTPTSLGSLLSGAGLGPLSSEEEEEEEDDMDLSSSSSNDGDTPEHPVEIRENSEVDIYGSNDDDKHPHYHKEDTDPGPPPPPRPTPAGKRGHNVDLPLLGESFSCNLPLVAVDLAGGMKRLDRLYSRCVYCGMACQALSVNMTNLGLSCGQHALPDEYPASHRLWRHLGLSRDRALGRRPPTAPPLVPPAGLGPCFVCGVQDALQLVDVYDYHFCLFKLPLCAWHLHACRETIRPDTASRHPPPPVRFDHLRLSPDR